MIVITGPGRSGTSFLADLYRNLRFDPGGGWQDTIRAGREQKDVVAINSAIMEELNVPRAGRAEIGEQRWDSISEQAARYSAQMRSIAEAWEVVKDPRFTWTLRAWLEAGAKIDHVVVTLRPIKDVVQSAVHAGMAKPTREDATNVMSSHMMFRIGCLLTTLGEYQVPHTTLSFPAYLSDPEQLYRSLVFPRPVKYSKFEKVLRKTFKPGLVTFGAETLSDPTK